MSLFAERVLVSRWDRNDEVGLLMDANHSFV